jgi:hypothetical protein
MAGDMAGDSLSASRLRHLGRQMKVRQNLRTSRLFGTIELLELVQ